MPVKPLSWIYRGLEVTCTGAPSGTVSVGEEEEEEAHTLGAHGEVSGPPSQWSAQMA